MVRSAGSESLTQYIRSPRFQGRIVRFDPYLQEVYIGPGNHAERPMATKKCPVCGVSVKTENLERHLRNQHPREKVDVSDVLSDQEQEAVAQERAASRPGLTKGGKRLVLVAGIVVAALVALVVLYPLLSPPGPTTTDFTLTSTDNTTVSIAAWRGHPVLVEFMDLDCPYCEQESPVLVSLYTSTSYNFTARGVRFVSIDMNFEGAQDTAARINSERSDPSSPFYGSSWPYCLDPGGTVATNYGATQTPTIFILNKDGTVAHKYVGTAEASAANLVSALNAALGG